MNTVHHKRPTLTLIKFAYRSIHIQNTIINMLSTYIKQECKEIHFIQLMEKRAENNIIYMTLYFQAL